jgi:hypothetical protein
MSTLGATVFDAIAALPDRGCSLREVVKALPDIDRERVTSAVHRLSEKGVLVHDRSGFAYSIAPGATRPTDGRGRPRKREQATRCFESSPATLRIETPR